MMLNFHKQYTVNDFIIILYHHNLFRYKQVKETIISAIQAVQQSSRSYSNGLWAYS